jgi:hypothetical protein
MVIEQHRRVAELAVWFRVVRWPLRRVNRGDLSHVGE